MLNHKLDSALVIHPSLPDQLARARVNQDVVASAYSIARALKKTARIIFFG